MHLLGPLPGAIQGRRCWHGWSDFSRTSFFGPQIQLSGRRLARLQSSHLVPTRERLELKRGRGTHVAY